MDGASLSQEQQPYLRGTALMQAAALVTCGTFVSVEAKMPCGLVWFAVHCWDSGPAPPDPAFEPCLQATAKPAKDMEPYHLPLYTKSPQPPLSASEQKGAVDLIAHLCLSAQALSVTLNRLPVR